MTSARWYPWYVVGILSLVNALSYLDRQVMSILVSPIQAQLGFSDTQIGLLLGPAFMSLFVLAGTPMGRIADRHDRSLLLAAGIAIWSAGTVATALSGSFTAMMLSRAAVGLGEACVVPGAYSLVADYFAPERRARATSWITIGIPIGTGVALFGGGLLLRAYEAVAGTVLPLVGSRAPWALVLGTFGLAGILVAGLVLTVRDPRRAPATAATATDPAQRFTSFLRRHPASVTIVLLPYILLTFMQVATIVWIPTLLTRRLGMTPADAATLYGTIIFIVPVLATLGGGWIADWLSRRYAAGPFLLVAWLAPFYLPGTLLLALGTSLAPVVAGLILISIVGGICNTTVYPAVQAIAPAGFRGRILALYGLSAQLAGIGLGPLATALVTDRVFGDRAMLHLAIVAVTVPAWIVTIWCGVAGRRHYARLRALAS